MLNISSATEFKSESVASPASAQASMHFGTIESHAAQQFVPSNGLLQSSGESTSAQFTSRRTGSMSQTHQDESLYWKNSPFSEDDISSKGISLQIKKQKQPSVDHGMHENLRQSSSVSIQNDAPSNSVVLIMNEYMPKHQQQQQPQERQQHIFGDYHNQGDGSWAGSPAHFVHTQNLPSFALPPPGMSPMVPVATHCPATLAHTGLSSPHDALSGDYRMEDAKFEQANVEMIMMDASDTMAVFGNDGFEHNRSPFASREDAMTAWLFGGQQGQQYGDPGMNLIDGMMK